jgi:hypothetical protein
MNNRPSLARKRPGHPGRCKSFGLRKPSHNRTMFLTGSPGSVNLNALAVAVEEPGLEFFAFDASYVGREASFRGRAH